jgi:carbon monoxide dehydrogenase subunit G
MHSALNSARCYQAVLLAAMAPGSLATPSRAARLMPPAQQNALVRKYCAVCHTDAAKNGGLSLQHFDAAQAPPSLTAMLLSKLTGGVLLKTVREAPANAGAAALIEKKMRSGAMGAAGIPIPDKATIDALIHAFAVESAAAMDWTVERAKEAAAPMLTASILREAPSARNAGEAEVYRLIASCNSATQEGEMQLAWSPVAQSGTLTASVDGNAAARYRVEGSEKMGNGSGVVLHGLAALALAETKRGVSRTGLPFPAESLTISDLFPGETVTFSFANLPKDAQKVFAACFPGADSSNSLTSSESGRLSAEQ